MTVAAVLLGAHYLRSGNVVFVALCLCAPLLFLYRRRLSLVLLQLFAYFAAASWIVVAVQLVAARRQEGRAWWVAALILASVSVVTALAGALLNSRTIAQHYPR